MLECSAVSDLCLLKWILATEAEGAKIIPYASKYMPFLSKYWFRVLYYVHVIGSLEDSKLKLNVLVVDSRKCQSESLRLITLLQNRLDVMSRRPWALSTSPGPSASCLRPKSNIYFYHIMYVHGCAVCIVYSFRMLLMCFLGITQLIGGKASPCCRYKSHGDSGL